YTEGDKNVENTKKRRFYKKGEVVWVVSEKKKATFVSFDKEKLEATVNIEIDPVAGEDFYASGGVVMKQYPIYEIDKLKFQEAKENKPKPKPKSRRRKVTYFASVKGGTIPTKDKENAGRDTYARLEPTIREGKEI